MAWFIVEAGLMGKWSMGIDSYTAEALRSILDVSTPKEQD